MLQIRIHPEWKLRPSGAADQDALDSSLIALLALVQETGSLASAARTLGCSYRHAWGQIQAAQQLFGQPLIEAGRGKNATLTELAHKLIWADKRVSARLSPLLESLASEVESELARASSRSASLRLNASHGFAVAALLEELEALGVPVDLRYRNSLESVAALSRAECDMAGFHVPIGPFQQQAAQRYLAWLRPDSHRLVHLAVRRQGLFVATGNPKQITGLADLRRGDVRFVNRTEGSGTRFLTELLLQQADVNPREVTGYDDTEFTHSAVAAFIASGMADAGIGVQTAAQRFGLTFLPLIKERYFFAVPAHLIREAPIADALEAMRSNTFRGRIAALAGYESAHTGKILTLAEAF